MSKATAAPADETSHWPLVIGICLLVIGAWLNKRLGNDGVAWSLAALAVALPLFGFYLRSFGAISPRIRRVFVNEEAASIAVTRLESAQFVTPSRQPKAEQFADAPLPLPFFFAEVEEDDGNKLALFREVVCRVCHGKHEFHYGGNRAILPDSTFEYTCPVVNKSVWIWWLGDPEFVEELAADVVMLKWVAD